MYKSTITIIGPFATEYSLAKVNRNLAMALDTVQNEYNIRLWGDAHSIDKLPSATEYKRYPVLRKLYNSEVPVNDITIFNNFPKSVYANYGLAEMPGVIKIGWFAWEESIYPERFVKECNTYMHGIIAFSSHTKDVFQRSGIKIPITVISAGLDVPFAKSEEYNIKCKAKFKFLHVSSGIYRKGIDVLLKAFYKEFKDNSDVALILKLFPNQTQSPDIQKVISKNSSSKCQVIVINEGEISDGQLKSIYEQADCVVAPSRAEGFGLSMAEAMMLRKPLITTAYSGHMDFCSEENSFLVDYDMVLSESHLGITGARIAEPKLDNLASQMKYVYENIHSDAVAYKVERAYEQVKDFTWNNAAKKIRNFVEKIKKIYEFKNKKIAVITTYNSKCGIAEYSTILYSRIFRTFGEIKILANYDISDRVRKDKNFVERTWQTGETDFARTITFLKNYKPDILQVQYNNGFYSIPHLEILLNHANNNNIPVYLTLHCFTPQFRQYADIFKKCEKIFVHSISDFKKMLVIGGGLKNIVFLEHGINMVKDEDKFKLREKIGLTEYSPIIGSHGLIHDRKGLLELIKGVAILKQEYPKILLLLVNALNPNNQTSTAVFGQMQKLVAELDLEKNVQFINKFLEFSQIIKFLQMCDIIVLPYGDVKEGASGAVRTAIVASRPIIITNSYIFESLDCGIKMPNNKPETIAKYVKMVLSDEANYLQQKHIQFECAIKNSWDVVCLKYLTEIKTF